MQRNMRVMALEVIYQLLLVFGFVSGFVWIIDGFNPYSPWLYGMLCVPASLFLTFVNYFIRDRINAIKLKKYRRHYPPLYFDSKTFR